MGAELKVGGLADSRPVLLNSYWMEKLGEDPTHITPVCQNKWSVTEWYYDPDNSNVD